MTSEKVIDALLEEVKTDLEITNILCDIKIKKYLKEFINKIISVCNRNDFPSELNYLAVKYAEDCFYYYKNIDNNGSKEISSISDSGQNISYKNDKLIKKEDVDLNIVINKNSSEISNYSRVRW